MTKKINEKLINLIENEYVEHYIPITKLANKYNINQNTLYTISKRRRWKEKREMTMSDMGIANKVRNALNQLLMKLSVDDLKNGKTADTISKINKLLKDLNPEKDILGYLLAFGHDLISFAKLKEDPVFIEKLEEYLPQFSEYIKEKYVKN